MLIHIILHDRISNIRNQIMQDFAKTRPAADRELIHPKSEWKIDVGSVLFGVLLGAIVVFAGLKGADPRQIQPTTEQLAEENAEDDSSTQFQFYTELKRDDLYPAFSE